MVAFSNGGPPTLASQLSSMALGAYYVNFCWDPRQTLTNIFPLDYWHQGEYNLKELAIQWQHNSGRLRKKISVKTTFIFESAEQAGCRTGGCRKGWMQNSLDEGQFG